MNKPPRRTSISADNLRAVQAPPTRIQEKEGGPSLEIDPEKLIRAWASSVEVLHEVVQVVQETQEDNFHTRQVSTKSRNIILAVLAITVGVNLGNAWFLQSMVSRAEEQVLLLLEKQAASMQAVQEASSETLREASRLRKGPCEAAQKAAQDP